MCRASQVKGTNQKVNLLALIDRLNSHNELFPDVAYTIKGFMDNKSGFMLWIKRAGETLNMSH